MLRSPLWEITKWMLDVVDMVFDTLMTIATFDILNNNFIMNWYFVLCGLIGFFVLIRLLVVMTKSYFNEEYASKTSIINTLMKIALITLIISLVPVAIGYIASITNSFLDSLGVLNGDEQFRMSDAIVKSMGIEEGVDWRTIKINERSGWFGAYKYDFNFF